MDAIKEILQLVGVSASALHGTYSVVLLFTKVLRDRWRDEKTSRVLEFMTKLGMATDEDIRQAVNHWAAPSNVTEAIKKELTMLLSNLVRGARFHSTNGTPLSSYLRCERLIEQLLQNIEPQCKAGDKIQNWELKTFLGMGSFGEVWRAENSHFPESHVFKFFTNESGQEWLTREAGALMAVKMKLRDCTNVIDYLDVAIDAEPYPYIVLEYADLGSLEDWLLQPQDDRLQLNLTELMHGIVHGLADAHKHGISHRDLKPANILLTDRTLPIPKIADFGLSSVEHPSETQSSLRSELVLVGTRMYHPPEASDPFKVRRSTQDDVFAIGVVWYQLLTNELVRPPYDFVDRLNAVGVDSRTIKMVSRCLAHPDRRYLSACELYDELDVETPPGPGEWDVPEGCFDVAGVAREYLERSIR